MKKPIDISGKRFGRLTAIKYTHTNKDNKACWECVCDCGNITNTTGKSLRSGATKSCGCYANEIRVKSNLIHGDASRSKKTKEYYIWRSIINRCTNKKNKDYSRYGGKGIEICELWKNSYSSFLSDLGRAPDKNSTVDRIDNNKGYQPGNCRWTTWKEQQNNKSNNRLLSFEGKTLNIESWSKITGLKYGTIVMRLHRGWSVEKTLSYGIKNK